MQTYSHIIITAALNRLLKQKEERDGHLAIGQKPLPPLQQRAALIGSFMPDVPLTLAGIVFIAIDLIQGNSSGFESDPMQSWTGWLFDYAFFNVWWVKLLHNLFHAPLLIFLLMAIGYFAWKGGKGWGASCFWFATSCLLHTAIDIPLHHNDGPLVFFPLDWQTRFYSPVSYWDPKYYGVQFAIAEHILILVLLIYLLTGWWRRRRERLAAAA